MSLEQAQTDLRNRHFTIWDNGAEGKSRNAHRKLKMTDETLRIFQRRLSGCLGVSIIEKRRTAHNSSESADMDRAMEWCQGRNKSFPPRRRNRGPHAFLRNPFFPSEFGGGWSAALRRP